MASVNKVILVGNLGRDPEMRTFPSGDQVCNVSLATTDRWKDKQSGEPREATEWHRLVFNGRLAEIAAQYLRKGSQIYVEGAIRTRKYTDKDGVDKYATDIRVDQLQMLGSRQAQQGAEGDGYDDGYQRAPQQAPQPRQQPNAYAQARGARQPPRRPPPPTQGDGFDGMDDDIPF